MKELKEEMLASLRRKVRRMVAMNAGVAAQVGSTMDVQHTIYVYAEADLLETMTCKWCTCMVLPGNQATGPAHIA